MSAVAHSMAACAPCRGFSYVTDPTGRKVFPCSCNDLSKEMKWAGIPFRLYSTPDATKELKSLWIHGTGNHAKDVKIVGYLKRAIRLGKVVRYIDCPGLRQARVEAIGGDLIEKPGSELLWADYQVLALNEIDRVKADDFWTKFLEAVVKRAYNNDAILMVSSLGTPAAVDKHYGKGGSDMLNKLMAAVGRNIFATGGGR